MLHSYRVRIHAHFDSFSEIWEVVVGVDLSRGEGLPRGVVKVVVSGQIPECPCAQGQRGVGAGVGVE